MTTAASRATPLTRATLDHVARTEPGTLWFLLPFAFTIELFAAAIPSKDRGAALFFAGLGALALATFVWAWCERRAAHRTLVGLLKTSCLDRGPNLAANDLELSSSDSARANVLRQYTVMVGLLVFGATFQTHFYARHRPWLATLTTLLLGWWSFPWGPLRTVRTLSANLRGGTPRSETRLLAELALEAPALAAWWRRLLALESKNPVKIAEKLATLAMALLLFALVLMAFVKAMLDIG